MLYRRLFALYPLLASLILAGCSGDEAPQAPVRPVLVVQPQPLTGAWQSYPGEVHARLEPELAFRIGGKLSKRLVEVGDRVRKDQALAELDEQDVRLQLEASRAQLAAAEANLALVSAEHARYRTLLARQLISRSQFDNAENQLKAGQARAKQARAEFEVANNQARYAVLRAPQAGVISARFAEVGQVLAAGQKVYALAADGDREVLIGVPEQASGLFKLGQTVQVELWSQPGKHYLGAVRELAPVADAQSRTFAARIAFKDKAPAELGQSARVSLLSTQASNLSVPLAALSGEQGQPFVWRVEPRSLKLERVEVQTGPYGEERVPILSGLTPDDWIVAAGVQLLQEGQLVRPIDSENRSVTLSKE